MRMHWLFFTSLLISTSSTAQNPKLDTTRSACIKEATQLLDEALTLMQKHYYKKDSVQWEPLITSAKVSLNQSSDCEAAYKAVQWCFDQIKENHSYIMPPVKAAIYNGNINSSAIASSKTKLSGDILHEVVEGDIGYISVPWITTTDESICTRFADSIQSVIKSFDERGVDKWIIDLRKNTGGNCWPMLAGLGPLLGNGTLGYFVSPSETIPIKYKDGVVMQGRKNRCSVTDPYTLKTQNKTILVLTSNRTASAGEIVAMAFKGLNNVYLYGEPTAGLTTANASYQLSDGSMLVLTVCKEADRTGKVIEGKIYPDEFVQSSLVKGTDDIKTAAIMFLQIQ